MSHLRRLWGITYNRRQVLDVYEIQQTYFGLFSFNSSGVTVTNAIYINPPAVKGSIAAVVSPAFSADSHMSAVRAPSRPPLAVTT